MASIDDFKANLIGGGARANQFRVTITPPSGISIGLDVRRTSFLVTASNLPASTLGEVAVPFRGRNIYVAGDRPAPEPWSTTFFNDTDFKVKCDDSNNTVEEIDKNEFIADIFIKPARSINFITLNFIATRTGVAFSEVGG